MNTPLTDVVYQIVELISTASPLSEVYLVGGFVRDFVLKFDPRCFDVRSNLMVSAHWLKEEIDKAQDLDIEVIGLSFEDLTGILSPHFQLGEVGKAFKVLRLAHLPIQIGTARLEIATGAGHKDFKTISFGEEGWPAENVHFAAAAQRRDFTMNALGLRLCSSSFKKCNVEDELGLTALGSVVELEDPTGGIEHLSGGILQIVSERFSEDALRSLRAMQFIARFSLDPTNSCMKACAATYTALKDYPKERICEEWNKMLLQGWDLRAGLEFLVDTKLIRLFPELENILNVPQNPKHHPEGNVWEHTLQCMEAFSEFRINHPEWPKDDLLVLGYAVLCHDLGKSAATAADAKGELIAHNHENISYMLAKEFMSRLFDPADVRIALVQKLCGAHMRPMELYKNKSGPAALRRLSLAVDGRLDLLLALVHCDQNGRNHPADPALSKPADYEAISWIREESAKASIKLHEKPKAILLGRHLIQHFNIPPGPKLGLLLNAAFEAQMDGKFGTEEEALLWMKGSGLLP